jgi:hypothetical protein
MQCEREHLDYQRRPQRALESMLAHNKLRVHHCSMHVPPSHATISIIIASLVSPVSVLIEVSVFYILYLAHKSL